METLGSMKRSISSVELPATAIASNCRAAEHTGLRISEHCQGLLVRVCPGSSHINYWSSKKRKTRLSQLALGSQARKSVLSESC